MVASSGPSGGRGTVGARGRVDTRHSFNLLLVQVQRRRAEDREGTGELGEEASAADRGNGGVTKNRSPVFCRALRHKFGVGSNVGESSGRGGARGLLNEEASKGKAGVAGEPELGPAGEEGKTILILLVTQRLRNLSHFKTDLRILQSAESTQELRMVAQCNVMARNNEIIGQLGKALQALLQCNCVALPIASRSCGEVCKTSAGPLGFALSCCVIAAEEATRNMDFSRWIRSTGPKLDRNAVSHIFMTSVL